MHHGLQVQLQLDLLFSWAQQGTRTTLFLHSGETTFLHPLSMDVFWQRWDTQHAPLVSFSSESPRGVKGVAAGQNEGSHF